MTDFSALSLSELAQLDAQYATAAAAAKAGRSEIQTELLRRHAEQVESLYTQSNKQSGDVKALIDGVKLKGSIDKKVIWDNDKLSSVAAQMPWEQVQHYFQIGFKVPEKVYTSIPPGELRNAIDAARTVKYGDLKIAIEEVV